MRKPPQLDGVQSALNDLISLEKERLDKDEAERKAMEEAGRKARDEAERKARDEAERKAREEEEARLARERAQRDEIESKQREKELGELKLKKEIEMKQRLEEERLRMKHEQEVKVIEAQKTGFPKWVIGVVAGVFIIAAVVVGIILVQMKNRADAQEKARIAAEQDSIEKEKKRGKEMAQLQTLLSKMEDKANLTEQELAEQRALQEQLKKLQKQDTSSTTKKKKRRKKKKKSGSSKGPSLDLGDPLSGISM